MCRFDNFSMGKKCTSNNFSVGKRVQNKQKKVKSCHLLSNKKGSDMTMSPLYDWKYVTCYILHYSISSQDQQQNLARNHDHVCHVSLTFPDSINFENWVWFVIYLCNLSRKFKKFQKFILCNLLKVTLGSHYETNLSRQQTSRVSWEFLYKHKKAVL